MTITSGILRERVTIQQKNVARDGFGAEVITWDTVATVWAQVEPLVGREFLEAQRQGAEATTKIRIRYGTTVEPEMRVTYRTHTYNVQSVIHVQERKREVVLMCQEVPL